jgi:hypothetical protein
MKYRNDHKASTIMVNPFLASRREAFEEQRDQDQGIKTARAAPSAEWVNIDTGGDGEDIDAGSTDVHSMNVDNDSTDSISFNQLYDGDVSWITPELLKTTVPPTEMVNKVKTKWQPRSATKEAQDRFRNWEKLLPSLQEPYSRYKSCSLGKTKAAERLDRLQGGCKRADCMKQEARRVTCLFIEGAIRLPAPAASANTSEGFKVIAVDACFCADQSVSHTLVENGLFPMSPKEPALAISMCQLNFYRALFARNGDAVHAFAGAMKLHYSRMGFESKNRDVCTPLGYASC